MVEAINPKHKGIPGVVLQDDEVCIHVDACALHLKAFILKQAFGRYCHIISR